VGLIRRSPSDVTARPPFRENRRRFRETAAPPAAFAQRSEEGRESRKPVMRRETAGADGGNSNDRNVEHRSSRRPVRRR
jgi:hypothetical protein